MPQVDVEITRGEGQTQASFPSAEVTSLDNLFWVNNDEVSGHQPTPSLSNPTAWMPAPIPVKLPDEPAPTSRGMAFTAPVPAGASYEITYFCAVEGHDGERGTIKVTA
jgi:hypothetical protein